MTEKQLVKRDESARTHVYTAAETAQKTQRLLLKDLLDKAFGGSSAELVLQALATKRASREELRQIRKLLDEYQN